MPTETKTAAEVESHILLKAEQDVEFRTRLIADPKGVIEAETGADLPEDVLVFVTEAVAVAQQSVSPVDTPLTEGELTQVMGSGHGRYCGSEGAGWGCKF